jgi:hypothetical protein
MGKLEEFDMKHAIYMLTLARSQVEQAVAMLHQVENTLLGDPEKRPRCSGCGSSRLRHIEGYFTTGVTHPDGGQEQRWMSGTKCEFCGGIEEDER